MSAVSARIPPSPSLSARMTTVRYLTEITISSDQNTSERTPRMFSSTTAMPWLSNDSRSAYKGLVPTSP